MPAFDASTLLSPCSQPSHTVGLVAHSPLGKLVTQALYTNPIDQNELAKPVELFTNLALQAQAARTTPSSEGTVYDWLPLTTNSAILSSTWRDVLLALTCRDGHLVSIGSGLRGDGSGCPQDMSEGTVLRIYCVLESLYPAVLMRDGAFCFRVRPRGAAYCHLVECLKALGRGEHREVRNTTMPAPGSPQQVVSAKLEPEETISDTMMTDLDGLQLPQITTDLWQHQQRSSDAVISGIASGKRGFADASAVGAGKTLTALATVVRVAQQICKSRHRRYGVLVLLPTPALLKEWLLEIAKHTRGFHVIEQVPLECVLPLCADCVLTVACLMHSHTSIERYTVRYTMRHALRCTQQVYVANH